jgi:mRNA interferase HigB
MRIIARKTLKDFWAEHPGAEQPLRAWFEAAQKADWGSPQAVKADYRSASILEDNRVCFNVGGNNYRLIVKINYPYRVVYVRFIGTHAEYDRIDARTI